MKIVTFGELLVRFSPLGNFRFSQASLYEASTGGAEANIAMSLAQFGDEVDYITLVPDDELGRTSVREVKKWDVNVKNILFEGQKMGFYFLEKGGSLRGGSVIYDREGSAFSKIDENTFDWEAILEDAGWFHWSGITPALSEGAAKACKAAIEVAHKKGIPISCDLNYRSKLWNYGISPKEIMPEMIAKSTIVLANEEDVASYLDIVPQESDYEEIEGFGKRCFRFVSEALVKRYPNIKYVISTLRETINASNNRWSGVVYNGQEYFRGDVHEIASIVDRVGGGDSFMAAYIHGKIKFADDESKALNFALAASALKLSIPGDYNIASEKEVLNLMDKSKIKKIDR